jgi:hypothetical protein
LFSNLGSNSFIIRTDAVDNLFNLYNVEQIMFNSADYLRAENRWLTYLTPQILSGERIQPNNPNFGRNPAIDRIGLESFRPYIYFQLNADKYPVEPRAHFRIRFWIETQTGANFTVPIKVTYYKDRAAFMADVAGDLAGTPSQENTRHFFQSVVFNTTTNSASIVIDVNNNQATYFMVHYATVDQRAPLALRVFSELEDEYGIYRLAQTTDYYDLPVSGLSTIADQYTPASAVYENPLRSIYNSNVLTLGYDISGVSNNLLDYVIQSGSNLYYDPNTITAYSNAKFTGLRYEFNLLAGGAPQPDPSISSLSTNTGWSMYFDKNSSNIIKDLYTSNAAYFSTYFEQKPLGSNANNEHLLVNWFKPGGIANLQEMFMTPAINSSINTTISSSSVFIPCINAKTPLTTDMSTMSDSYALDISGVSGVSFFLPPNELVKLDSLLLSFAYVQPVAPSADTTAIPYTRANNPFGLAGSEFNGAVYRNNSASAYTAISASNSWDDWYAQNRRNTKIGIYRTSDVAYMSTQSLQLSNALASMTINKITQVANYQNQLGTLRTREPGWGTYYTYTFESNARTVWDINASNYTWVSTTATKDTAPVYIAGETSYSNYFLTPANIYNYTYQPRSIGIATGVGIAAYDSTIISTFTADIPNSFTAVPFYMDPVTSNWTVGSFYGLSYTQRPAIPTSIVGAAPYYGPPGVYGWTNRSNTFQLHNGLQSNKPETFYWNAKLQFETLDTEYNPATDLTIFGGFAGISNEYQDTVMFMYENSNVKQDLHDLSTTTTGVFFDQTSTWRWGMESNVNYKAWDDQGGYNFLSYIHDVPVRPTAAEYGIHVRAYDPIPRFRTGLRFIGKNYTDFGRPTLWEIATEISSLSGYTPITPTLAESLMTKYASFNDISQYSTIIHANNAARFANGNFISHEYADALITFDKTFSTTQVFGKKIGYTGQSFTLKGYEDAIVQYITYFNNIRGVISVYTEILSTATGLLNQYVTSRYGSVLPPSILNRNRITDPLPFQFLLKSKLEPPYTTQFDEWGLGWNLGFNKRDTPPQTTITSDTFIRITQDYVYLRLNPELNMNTMSVSGKECRECCQESAAEDNKYFSKIILNNFGGYCRTAVQLPKVFNPILGKYETISCQLVDRNGNQIDNADCEYDFVVEITEITNKPTDDSTLQGTTADLNVYARSQR